MLKYEIVDNKKNEWVVFVHGIAGSILTWKKQIKDFSEKYNLLLLDLPGHGSNADNIIENVDIKKLNKGIKDTLDYLEIKKAHFVGMSLGTLVIASFAITYPSYINKIVFGGAAMKVKGFYKFCINTVDKIKDMLPYKKMYQFLSWFMMPKKNHAKSRKIFMREADKLNKKTMFAWIDYLSISTHPQYIIDKLKALNLETLFISGDEDHCFIKGTKSIFKTLHNTRIKIIKHCGHVCSIERYKEFNKYALAYLAEPMTA